MDKGVITRVIEAANQAPSGGNSQPWKFIVENGSLRVSMLPEKDHPVLNYKNRGTYVAFGALLENIKIAAQSLGFDAVTHISLGQEIFATISFNPLVEAADGELYGVIAERHSNRKPYATHPIAEEKKNYIVQDANAYPLCRVSLVEGEKIKSIAQGTGSDLYVFLQNQMLHKLLFSEMLWNEEDQHERSGLYVRTIEAKPPKSLALKALSNWSVAKFFHNIGLSKKIYEENAHTLASAGLCGAIIVPDSDESFVQAGRLVENVWLRTTKQGLSFQLVAGLSFLWQQMAFGEKKLFSESESEIIAEAYGRLRDAFSVKEGEIIAATFRIGESAPPMAVSYKRPAEVEWR